MPFLSFSRASSMDGSNKGLTNGHTSSSLRTGFKTRNGSIVSSTKPVVSFIPSQIDSLSATTPPHHRPAQTSSKLLFRDVLTLLHCVVANALSMLSWNGGLFSSRNLKSFLRDPLDVRDFLVQWSLGVLEIWALLCGVPAVLFLPGLVWMTGLCFFLGVIWSLGWLINGNRGNEVVRCCGRGPNKTGDRRRIQECVENELEFGDERWIFVNGMMTSNQALKSHITRLSRTFRRPILGIHQPTYGIFADILSCLLLRTFSGFPTPTTNALYDQLRSACLDSSIDKIVLLTHGTGGIIVSVVLDRLFADLPAGKDCLGKIEVYTFGNAAGWMPNPNRGLGHVPRTETGNNMNGARRNEENQKTISHIEHYANENDILARWGVLHNVREVLDNRYAGRVFLIHGTGGGLMVEGYLDQIWPICHDDRCSRTGKTCGNSCHIHSAHCETRNGCGNDCNEHANGNECGLPNCQSQGKVCEDSDCNISGHRMTCVKACKNDCEHEKECETHGPRCHGCETHGSKCDGRHDLVCSKNCSSPRDCGHPKECETHGSRCTGRHFLGHHHHSFLDQVVTVDIDTAVKREFTAQVASVPQKMMPLNLTRLANSNSGQRESHSHAYTQSLNITPPATKPPFLNINNRLSTGAISDSSSSPDVSPKSTSVSHSTQTQYFNREMEPQQMKALKRTSWNTSVDSCVDRARREATECEGMTVRQLSRLWRYVGGERVVGDVVSMSNGVGLVERQKLGVAGK